MYGVGRNSRSSAIQAQVLAELTSLDSAEERARLGAGIPARKDFFYLNGEKPVTGMEYLNWRELLRFGGSRARRRDRVLIPRPEPGSKPTRASLDPLPLYDVIHQEMLDCMRIADLHRQEYAAGGISGRQSAIKVVTARAKRAVTAIYGKAKHVMNSTGQTREKLPSASSANPGRNPKELGNSPPESLSENGKFGTALAKALSPETAKAGPKPRTPKRR
jgi:hypothetical protein